MPPRSELELRVAASEKGTLQRELHPAPVNARSRLLRTNATAVIGWRLRVRAGRRSGLVYKRGKYMVRIGKARRWLSHARMQTIGRIPADAEAKSSFEAARSLRNLGKWSWRRYVPAQALRFSVRRTSPTGTKSRISGMMSHQGEEMSYVRIYHVTLWLIR